jgi:hypothetical protein
MPLFLDVLHLLRSWVKFRPLPVLRLWRLLEVACDQAGSALSQVVTSGPSLLLLVQLGSLTEVCGRYLLGNADSFNQVSSDTRKPIANGGHSKAIVSFCHPVKDDLKRR